MKVEHVGFSKNHRDIQIAKASSEKVQTEPRVVMSTKNDFKKSPHLLLSRWF